MKRTFGITILTLMAGFSIMLSGCGDSSGQGLGLLQPYETGTPGGGGGTHTPSPSPSVSPTPSPTPATDIVLSSLTNPANMFAADKDVWAIVGFGLQDHDANKIVRFYQDTTKNTSKTDPKTPQEFTLNIEDGPNYLTNCSWLTGFYVEDPAAAGTMKLYLLVSDGFNTSNGRILLLTPEKDSSGNWKSEIKGKQLVPPDSPSGASISPFCVCADNQYIWWTEYTSNGSVYRADLTQDPIKVEQFMSGMDYPAGIDSNGGFVAIADSGNNRIVVANCNQDNASLPVPIRDGQRVQTVYAKSGYDTLRNPFEIKWLGDNHFIATDGMALGVNGSPSSSGDGQGHLWLWEGPDSTDVIGNRDLIEVGSGFTNPSGLQVLYDASMDSNKNRVDVAFVESVATMNQGALRFYSFDSKNYKKLVKNDDEYLEKSLNRPYMTENIVGTITSISPEYGEGMLQDPPAYIILTYTEGLFEGLNSGDIKRYTSTYPTIK